MALQDSFPGPSGVTDSTELRKGLAGLIVRDSAGNARPGIFPRHTNALVSGRSDMALNVAAFEGASVRGGGPLFMANDGVAVTPSLAAAPASNSRIDVLYFKQNESAAPYTDANNLPIFGVVTGTAAPAPTKPALTVPGAVELATITVPSTATTTLSANVVITQTFQFTAAAGGVLVFRTASERAAFAAAPGQLTQILGFGDTEWITPTLTSPWVSDAGKTVRYRRMNGFVYLQGRGISGSGTIFNLPAGFRPSQDLVVSGVSAASASVMTRVVVNANGNVDGLSGTSPTLDMISFPADA